MSDTRGLEREELAKLLRAAVRAGRQREVDPDLLEALERLADADVAVITEAVLFLARFLNALVEIEARLAIGEAKMQITHRQKSAGGWN